MASRDLSEDEPIFVVDGKGPSEGDFLLHGIAHLRNGRYAPPLEFTYEIMRDWARKPGGMVQVRLTLLAEQRQGRHWFQAEHVGDCSGVCPIPHGTILEGFYDAQRRKGYFRMISPRGPVALVRDQQEDWWRRIFCR